MHRRDIRTKKGELLLLAGLPAFFRHGALRAAAALLCRGAALFLVRRVLKAHQGSLGKKYFDERERQTAAVPAPLLPLTAHLNATESRRCPQ